MTHIEVLEKSFKTIDKMLENIVNGINADRNVYRYSNLTYYIQRYIQYNLAIGKITNKEIEFNAPIYLRDLYYSIYKDAEYFFKLYKPNARWSLEENLKSCFDEYHIFKNFETLT